MDRNTELLRAAEWNAPEPPEEKEPIEPETVDEIEDNRFTVTTASEADWALMKLGEIERLEAQNKELANNNINRIQDWLDKQNTKTTDSKNYFNQLLTDYIFEEKANNPKFKLVTPNGKL
ncbi:host-nuclease inhibitor Gam family protein, partial [Latilactobacillus sakei]|uniref:host-nuclease inhibitor Gam family protein n=1 Tax=Latilactobacillus sakei TaxID=1599 RepID=UPI000AFC72B5